MSSKAASDNGRAHADDGPESATESLGNSEKFSDAGSIPQPNEDNRSSDDDHQIDQDSWPVIDIVTVHGLHSAHGNFENHARMLVGSSTVGQWIDYEFSPAVVFSGRGFREEAYRLLRKISNSRDSLKKEKSHPIAFISHDIGGSILKQALYVASLDEELYDIVCSTKLMIFLGCPHRSLSLQDMEDKIGRLIFAESSVAPRNVTTSIQNLALNVFESNNHFIETKVVLHTHLVNIFSDHENPMMQVFDEHTSTMDLSFEKRFSSPDSHGGLPGITCPDIGEIIEEINERLCNPGDQNERQLCQDMLVSLSSPVRPLDFPRLETHQLDWLVNQEEFVKWRSSSSSQILILYGQTAPSILFEHLFRYVLGTKKPGDVVTNFTFHKDDVRFNSFEAFLNTTMAEWISQDRTIPTNVNTASSYRHYKSFGGFNDADAMYLLLKLRTFDVSGTTFFVLQNDDECPEMDSVFWKKMMDVISNWDRPWKFLLLRNSAGSVDGWLSNWPSIHVSDHDVADITTSAAEAYLGSTPMTNHSDYNSTKEWIFCVARRGGDLRKTALMLRNMNHFLPASKTWQTFLDSNTPMVKHLDAIMRDIMQLVPSEQLPLLAGLVSCILVAKRPLSKAELRGLANTLCEIDSLEAEVAREDPFELLERHLPGIFDLSHGETRLQYPELKKGFFRFFHAKVMKDGLEEAEAEQGIARACLAYLRGPAFARASEVMLARRKVSSRPPISSPRNDFADYAVRYWHVHMRQILTHFPSQGDDVVQFFQDEPAVRSWEKARVAISHPMLEDHALGLPLIALFASTGLHHSLTQWTEWSPNDDISMRAALVEAATVEDLELVKKILDMVDMSDIAAIEPVLHALSRVGNEETLCLLVSKIAQSCRNIQWPPPLICRAAWLGYSKITELLIDNGASLLHHHEHGDKGPLHLSVRNNHADVTDLLLKKGPKGFVDLSDRDGWTALHDAATYGHPQMVEKLIHAGADKDTKGTFRPINCACFDGKHAAARALLKNGVNPEYDVDHDDLWLPLPAAASYGYTKCVKELLECRKVNVDCRSPGGTPLFMAVNNRHLDTCQVLLKYEADPDSEINIKPVLVLAAEEDNLDAVKLLIERGDPSSDSRTVALHEAVMRGTNVEIIQFLLNNGAKSGGNTEIRPIILDAAACKSTEVLEALIEHHVNVDEVDDQGRTPLHAIENCSMTRVLLQAGANINVSTKEETLTPLHIAVDMGRTEVVKAMLEAEPGLELKSSSTHALPGFSALAFAVWRDNAEIAKLLLDAGANPNSKTERYGGVPLHLSIEEDVVRTVLEFDPDLGLEDESGDTPLNELVDWDEVTLPVIKMLLRQGSDINQPNKAGRTPLFKALEKSDLSIARLLLSKGADPCHISKRRGMPLHSTCHRGSFEAFQLILEKGGFVEKVLPFVGSVISAACMRSADSEDVSLRILQHLHDTIGQSKMSLNKKCGAFGCALSSACFWSSEDVVEWLLDKGASVQTKDDADRYPIHFAAYRDVSIFRRILDAGGDIGVRDKTNRTVLHVAVQSGSATLIKYVLEKDRSLLRARDKDNWAPLHYAVRGCSNWRHDQRHSRDEEEIVNLLFDEAICCSRDFTVHGHERENWSILELARFHGSGKEVRNILKTALKKQKGDDWMNGSGVVKRAFNHSNYCDHCLTDIQGLRFSCQQCFQVDLCYKCYSSKEEVHPGHEWSTIGPEDTEDSDDDEDDDSVDGVDCTTDGGSSTDTMMDDSDSEDEA